MADTSSEGVPLVRNQSFGGGHSSTLERVDVLVRAVAIAVFALIFILISPPLRAATLVGPSQSSPIAVTADGNRVVNVNPEDNSVSLFDVTSDPPKLLKTIRVGIDPESVAISPDGADAYVANSYDGTVSIVDMKLMTAVGTVPVGVEPMAVAVSPNGTRLYVANSSSNTLMVLNATQTPPAVIASIDLSPFGTAPRAISVTNNGDTNDSDETILVAMFFAQLRSGKTALDEGQDDQREGRVVAIAAGTLAVNSDSPARLAPISQTRFQLERTACTRSPGDAGHRIE